MPFDCTPPEIDTSNEVQLRTLVAARNLIKKGWCQNTSKAGKKYCMIGALMQVVAPEAPLSKKAPAERKIIFSTIKYLAEEIYPDLKMAEDRTPSTLVIHFNDSIHRRKRDVVKVYDRAIARLTAEPRKV